MSVTDLSPRDRLLRAATVLFAELGYDQTTSELIADAAGLPASLITKEFGGRRQLYLEVFQQVQEHLDRLTAQLPEQEPSGETYHRFIDRYLDYLQEHPEHAALWLQRWLNDAADLHEIEKSYVIPQAGKVDFFLRGLLKEELDVELVNWTVAWACQIFTFSGIPGHGGMTSEDLARFRRHLHALADLMLKEQGNSTPEG